MNDLKYVIIEPPDKTGILKPSAVIFNGWVNHVEMVPKGWKALSAGFCCMTLTDKGKIGIKVFGNSTSLNLHSKPSDATIIIKTLSRMLYV